MDFAARCLQKLDGNWGLHYLSTAFSTVLKHLQIKVVKYLHVIIKMISPLPFCETKHTVRRGNGEDTLAH
jgi:hypothetical protein